MKARIRSNRRTLEIEAEAPLGGDVTTAGTTLVIFPDGTVCELEQKTNGSEVKYRLKLRERRGVLQERRGACSPATFPALTGGPIDVMHDGDGDPGTPNTTLLTGQF